MVETSIQYPEFLPNQILTADQLNDLRDYCIEQQRESRHLLVGTGIVCGLGCTISSEGEFIKSVTIDAGFGIGSEGELITRGTQAACTSVRCYRDPASYQKFGRTEDLWELVPDDAASTVPAASAGGEAEPKPRPLLTGSTEAGKFRRAEWNVVLYLEQVPVDLDWCNVTSCDRRGSNIQVTVRIVLVPVKSLPRAIAEPSPISLFEVTRVNPTEGTDVDLCYTRAVREGWKKLQQNIVTLFEGESQKRLLAIQPLNDELQSFSFPWSNTPQYAYDALKHVAAAYNEALAAAARLVPCRAEDDYPLHLVLGGGLGDSRHYFKPAAVRNVMQDDLPRVQALFERLRHMMHDLDKPAAPPAACGVILSQSEDRPLAARAIPWYFPTLIHEKKYWYLGEAGSGNSALDPPAYAVATFFRAHGHFGATAQAAGGELRRLIKAGNLEAQVFLTYCDGHATYLKELAEQLANGAAVRRQGAEQLREALKQEVLEHRDIADQVFVEVRNQAENEQALRVAKVSWIRARGTRVPLADLAPLKNSYSKERQELVSLLTRLHAVLRRIQMNLDELAPAPFEYLDAEIGHIYADGLAKQLSKKATQITSIEVLGNWIPKTRLTNAKRLSSAAGSLRAQVDELLEQLPEDLAAFHFESFLEDYLAVARDTLGFWLLMRVLAQAVVGITKTPVGDGDLPLDRLEEALVDDELLMILRSSCHLRLQALDAAWDVTFAKDPVLFENLRTKVSGLEHLGGVPKGGTLVLLCDGASRGERVIADFALAGRLPCVSIADPWTIALPPIARVDHRVVELQPLEGGNGYEAVRFDFNLDINAPAASAAGLSNKSLLGATLAFPASVATAVGACPVIRYSLESVNVSGTIDHFSYRLRAGERTTIGHVVVALVCRVSHGLRGVVKAEGTGEAIPDAIVTLTDKDAKAITAHSEGSSGSFQFPNLVPGDYQLIATKSGYAEKTSPVCVEVGKWTHSVISMQPMASRVVGTVVSGTDEQAVVGATVVLTRGKGKLENGFSFDREERASVTKPGIITLDPLYDTKTDRHGRFSIENVVNGRYTATATCNGYLEMSVPGVEVYAGAARTVNFVLTAKQGTIKGKVTNVRGIALAGTQVSLSSSEVKLESAQTMTSEKGEYSFSSLRPGQYRLFFSLSDHRLETRTVDLSAGATKPCDVTLQSLFGSINGVVRDSAEQPIPEVTVECYVGTGVIVNAVPVGSCRTESSGAFSFPRLSAGDYQLMATAAGHVSGVVSVRVKAGESTTQDVTVVALTGSLKGKVNFGVSKQEWTAILRQRFVELTAPVSNQGTFTFTGLEAGTYIVYAFAPTIMNIRETTKEEVVSITAGQMTRVTLEVTSVEIERPDLKIPAPDPKARDSEPVVDATISIEVGAAVEIARGTRKAVVSLSGPDYSDSRPVSITTAKDKGWMKSVEFAVSKPGNYEVTVNYYELNTKLTKPGTEVEVSTATIAVKKGDTMLRRSLIMDPRK